MPINLNEIPGAVKSYLDTKVSVAIAPLTPATGNTINPSETFEIRVDASNATSTAGGVVLRNVKYRLSVDNGSVAKLVVPQAALLVTTDLAGNTLPANQEVTAMIVENQLENELGIGATNSLRVSGKATGAASGGNTTVRARVLADVDLNALFPKGEDTPAATRALAVVG